MPVYSVILTRDTTESVNVTVTADDEDQAAAYALELAPSDQGHPWSADDNTPQDAYVTSVEPASEPVPERDGVVMIPKHGGFDPDRMNGQRIGWGGNAIVSIMRDTGTEIGDALSDLLSDLMHWSHANGQDFATELRRATFHFEQETSEGGGW